MFEGLPQWFVALFHIHMGISCSRGGQVIMLARMVCAVFAHFGNVKKQMKTCVRKKDTYQQRASISYATAIRSKMSENILKPNHIGNVCIF